MNKELQRIAIAEACGWEINKRKLLAKPPNDSWQYLDTMPNYLNDLNAMHEAENVLTEEQRVAYSNHTYDVACEAQRETEKWRWISLTAAQRAEAFLRTINKWEETK